MLKSIFKQIALKREALLKMKQYDFELTQQFIDLDVGLLLKEREDLRKTLRLCRDQINLLLRGQQLKSPLPVVIEVLLDEYESEERSK